MNLNAREMRSREPIATYIYHNFVLQIRKLPVRIQHSVLCSTVIELYACLYERLYISVHVQAHHRTSAGIFYLAVGGFCAIPHY